MIEFKLEIYLHPSWWALIPSFTRWKADQEIAFMWLCFNFVIGWSLDMENWK